jgi:hypothetical protein
MSLILGILDSGGAAAGGGTAYESIATVTVGSGGAANVTFSSIPATYTHLQIRWANPTSNTGGNVIVNFNNDTSTSNYAMHNIRGNGSTASTLAFTSASGNSTIFGNESQYAVADILDYANTNKYKVSRILGGADYNGSGQVSLNSSLWMNTAAISTIKLTADLTGGWAQYSSIALYGIKGS